MATYLLAGDLGGTKTLLALAELVDGRPRLVVEQRFDSRAYPDFASLLARFIDEAGQRIDAACLGLAGPTDGRTAQLTYLPWQLDAAALEARFGIAKLRLVNDFLAAAQGIECLEPEHLQILQRGKPVERAPRLVIGAGTGLGVAGLVWRQEGYQAVPGEGGHMGFAPQTAQQADLWRWLHAQRGRVTSEDVVCGAGLARLYAFLGGATQSPADVGEAAIAGRDPRATQALELWLSIYGAFAGDLALAWLAQGGVYLAGGVSARLIPNTRAAPLIAAFRAKREHQALAEAMPIYLVLEERLGLLGALHLAQGLNEAC